MFEDRIVSPWVPERPLLAVVGQSPGSDEYRRGRPFIGREGKVLRGWLADVGLDPDEDVLYSNVHDVYHPDNPTYIPSTKECKEGYARLAGEFGLVSSLKCVVLLGGPASHMVFKGRMGEMHGRQSTVSVGGGVLVSPPGKPAREPGGDGGSSPPTSTIPVLACYHPGYYWHSKGAKARAVAEGEILSVLQRAVDIVHGKSTEVELPPGEYVREVVIT